MASYGWRSRNWINWWHPWLQLIAPGWECLQLTEVKFFNSIDFLYLQVIPFYWTITWVGSDELTVSMENEVIAKMIKNKRFIILNFFARHVIFNIGPSCFSNVAFYLFVAFLPKNILQKCMCIAWIWLPVDQSYKVLRAHVNLSVFRA